MSKDSAMRQWAVYACISTIAETLAQLPLKLKRPDGKGGIEDATDHPLFDIVKNLPNKQMTSFNWRETQQVNLMTTGNCYNLIQRKSITGEVVNIWPVSPSSVSIRKVTPQEASKYRLPRSDRYVYDIAYEDGTRTFMPKDLLHIVGLGWDGVKGESVITNFAKDAIGNAIGLDGFQASALKNGIFPSGVLEHPSTLGDSKESFIKALEERYAGVRNVRRPMILENGLKFSKHDVSLVDKQFVEQLKMSANQICGIFKIPPHKIGIFEKNTNYNNTEQGNRAFLDGTMQQWVIRWEQAMNWKLLTEAERREGYFFKFNFDGLLRPDAKTRAEIAWQEWQMGTPLNEIRKRNDQNPLDGGDVSYVPVNMIPAHLAGATVQQSLEQIDQSKQEVIEKDAESVRKYERNSIARLIEKDKEAPIPDFEDRLEQIYRKINTMLTKDTAVLLRCFMGDDDVNSAVSKMREEYAQRKEQILQSRQVNYEDMGDER